MEVSEIFMFTSEQVRGYWSSLEEALDREPELWRAYYSKEEIKEGIAENAIQVWGVSDEECIHLVFMTKVEDLPLGRALDIFWMFGTGLKKILPCVDLVMTRFACSMECKSIRITGRRGWDKVLRPYGFKFESLTLERPVRVLKEH